MKRNSLTGHVFNNGAKIDDKYCGWKINGVELWRFDYAS